ncbi:C40 family peptidase [Dickeya poaceiphila]|uniref:Glycoside hydrolase n=1 Tax=Dickeya poaceiphila TaxID=568768 RepID=A0A5B8I772_9GAMM|nr:C40 family peptidase [Dickeya poaceiphila]QDX29788.1 glycoside hydrolase [Dickeya poaceiphila]
MRLFITLFLLFFSNLFFNLANANPHGSAVLPRKNGVEAANNAIDESKKSKAAKNTNKKGAAPTHSKKPEKTTQAAPVKTASVHDKNSKPHNDKKPLMVASSSHSTNKKQQEKNLQAKAPAGKTTKKSAPAQTHSSHKAHEAVIAKTTSKKGRQDKTAPSLNATHQKRYQHAKLTAMNKLMSQIGKRYHWGGATPRSGFDCSGLVYYAYKDVVKIQIPRTANEMFHLRDAAPIKKSELESGDLVFFHITNRGAADHVGVYLGNGRFIQSPRSGADIKISKLSEDYWQDHYVGARRVVTPKTIR